MPAVDPAWLKPLLAVLAALLLFGWFSPAIIDSDFWWHLRTGQYIVEHQALPYPDQFSWTVAKAPLAYVGEDRIRQFNLTHEWLAQALLFLTWKAGGFGGVVAVRALSMLAVCLLVGWIARRRSESFYGGAIASVACGWVLHGFALDRPFQVTFLCLAGTLAILEFRRGLWLLPPIFLIWANCHGGFFLGFVVLGAYCAESVWRRRRDWLLFGVAGVCLAVSALNPNGLAIFRTLLDYRSSYMTSRLLEWAKPNLWPPSAFSTLLAIAIGLMLWQWRRVRIAHWLLLAAFTAAALSATRNTVFVGIVAPVLAASAWPWRRPLPLFARMLAPALPAAGIAALWIGGGCFEFRAALWKYPAGAADFLKAHAISEPLFNTYEHGGYLIWRLAPERRVFIDGRALSESLFMDYARILYNHDNNDGQPSGEQLLDRYGVGVIAMNTFEPATGNVYVLAPALADPAQKTWKLVYQDPQSVIFMRTPPAGVAAMNSLDVLTHMETECRLVLENQPQYPRCARSLGEVFLKIGDRDRARRWLAEYVHRAGTPDPEAEQALRSLVGR